MSIVREAEAYEVKHYGFLWIGHAFGDRKEYPYRELVLSPLEKSPTVPIQEVLLMVAYVVGGLSGDPPYVGQAPVGSPAITTCATLNICDDLLFLHCSTATIINAVSRRESLMIDKVRFAGTRVWPACATAQLFAPATPDTCPL